MRIYSGEILEVLGRIDVTASYHNQSKQLSLLVVPMDGPKLLGQDFLKPLNLDWEQVHNMQVVQQQALQNVLSKHSTLFHDEMGTLKSTKVTIRIQPNARPCFFTPGQYCMCYVAM